MKYVVLSFDDAREDFYTRAYPLLKKYGLTASVNVISDFVGRTDLKHLDSGANRCATWQQLGECRDYGIEIANHSANHKNQVEAVRACNKALDEHLGPEIRGFVSPGSYVCEANLEPFRELMRKREILYIRSGNQIRRDGYGYALLYIAARLLNSSFLFYLHNKRFTLSLPEGPQECYPSVMVNEHHSLKQTLSFLGKLKDGEAVILMFHSILQKGDASWGKDKWYNSTDFFEALCRWLADKEDISVLTNAQLHSLLEQQVAPHA